MRTVVIVEGVSDKAAVEALARSLGRDLALAGVSVDAIGGAHAVGAYVERLTDGGGGPRLAGLCDLGEAAAFARALERAGLGVDLAVDGLEQLGFFVCAVDLEDELIRALGPPGVEAVLEAQGELRSWRSFQRQPAQRERPVEAQLRRFMGTRSGRKALYARALVEAGAPDRVPPPLMRLLDHVVPVDKAAGRSSSR